jgi:hypothetical protein
MTFSFFEKEPIQSPLEAPASSMEAHLQTRVQLEIERMKGSHTPQVNFRSFNAYIRVRTQHLETVVFKRFRALDASRMR